MINVQYTHGDKTPVTCIEFGDFAARGNAVPTGRVLDGSADHGYAEEWEQPGHVVIDGDHRPARMVFLFAAAEVQPEAEDYPWDEQHAARILLAD